MTGAAQGVASIDPTQLGELTATQKRLAGGEYEIFDRQGRLVYENPETHLTWEERLHPQQADPLLPHALRGKSILGEMTPDIKKGRHFVARVPIGDTGWVAGASRPVKLVLAPVWTGLLSDALLTSLAISPAFLLAYLLARTIARPLLRLERDAHAMGQARIEAPPDPEAPREVRSLRSTVAGMATDLILRAEALRRGEQRFQAVLENSLDVAYRRDLRHDRYEYLSPVIEQMTGFSPEEMNELTKEQVLVRVHPEDVERVRHELNEAERTGTGTIEYRFQCKDGTYCWLADYFVVQKDEEGRPRYYSGSVRNITGLKQAQELLFNVIKHARVKKARIQVRRLGRYLCLTVSDRGRGFDPQQLQEAAGFGLLSIRERIELLGGRMKTKSAPGQGSTFFIVLPEGEMAGTDSVVKEKSDGQARGTKCFVTAQGGRLRVLLANEGHERRSSDVAQILRCRSG